jgi:hypothetical protein
MRDCARGKEGVFLFSQFSKEYPELARAYLFRLKAHRAFPTPTRRQPDAVIRSKLYRNILRPPDTHSTYAGDEYALRAFDGL